MVLEIAQRSSWLRILTCLFLGVCLITLATLLPVVWPNYYKTFLANQLKMTPDSKTYEAWRSSPVPIYIEFYFFNWTNRDKLEEDGEFHVPQLQEVGPYRFNERIDRVNVTWNDNSTVTYKQAKWWFFDEKNSKGSLDDNITTLNVVALTAAFTVREWSFFMRKGTSAGILATNQKIHVVRPVRELLFEGYSDSLITMARGMPAFASVKVPFDKFGWFYQRNGTTFMDGVFNMNTGVDDIQKMGKLESWNYKNSTDFFEGDCANVMGTTGQLFGPGQTRDRPVEMFSPDLCRSLSYEYEEDTDVHGVTGYRYTGGLSMLDNGTTYPENECYCNGECVPAGVVNVTSCRFGAPAFASFPHFYLADPFFKDAVRGMEPKKEKHQFYLTLEPTTGIPLDVAARFQINLLLQPIEDVRLYQNIPTLFFPMIWFQQRATLTPDMAGPLRLLVMLRHLGVVLSALSASAACFLLGYGVLMCKRRRTEGTTTKEEKNKEEANMYVAAIDFPNNEKKRKSQYMVMKHNSKKADLPL